jgi:hypothetical protein
MLNLYLSSVGEQLLRIQMLLGCKTVSPRKRRKSVTGSKYMTRRSPNLELGEAHSCS